MDKNQDVDLPQNFWAIPRSASTMMTTRQVKQVLLHYDGRISAHGELWDIITKKIGPGVYRVSLKEWDAK